jgi:hypothetical protein
VATIKRDITILKWAIGAIVTLAVPLTAWRES